ncbi:MAG: putative signal transducing protein, partial [Bradymonadaceae bacterium]
MPTDLVTVRTFNAPTPAKLAATELEEANIRVRVVDDEIVAADPLLSQAFGGVKLKVPESQVERAREILTDARDGTLDDRLGGEETEFEPLSDPEREEWDRVSQGLRCPSCGDSSVGLDGRWLAAWILASLGAWWSGPLWPAA